MTKRKAEPWRKPVQPERLPEKARASVADKKLASDETEEELDEALEQTFPASDPIAMESTLVPGSRR